MATKKESKRSKAAVAEDVDVEEVTSPKKKKKKESSSSGGTLDHDYLATLDDTAKAVHLNHIAIGNEQRMQTGLLCLDIILGRGIGPTWLTIFGAEQTAKTTLAMVLMAATIKQAVPIPVLWDAEQSSGSSADYMQNILGVQGVDVSVESIFGVRKDGKWKVKPTVYYQDDANGEKFFNWFHALLVRLPDKRFVDNDWWLVYENTKVNQAKYSSRADRKMTSGNEGIWVKAKDGDKLQAVILLDSYPALMPTAQDNDEHTKAMAVQARMFSLHLPRVKGYLRSKRVAVVGINQLRLNPGAMFGSPETEPGGQALRYNSDQRIRLSARSSGIPFNPKLEGMIETEPSIDGRGVDTYRYTQARTIKNKLSTPNRETWFRLWISNSEGEGMGYDPVWDAFYACVLCGFITGKRSKMVLDIPGLGEGAKPLNWMEFKQLILGDSEQKASVCKKLGYKPIDLRKGLTNMSKKGTLEDNYLELQQANKSKKAGVGVSRDATEDDDVEDDEDD